MGRPVRPASEPSREAVARLPWLRGRLLSWFARGSPLPLARAGQDAVRGRGRGAPVAENDRRRSRVGL